MYTKDNISTDGTVTATGAVSGAALSVDSVTSAGAISGTTGTFSGDVSASGGFECRFSFSQADCAESQSAVALAVNSAGDAAILGFPTDKPGSITGIAVWAESARTAGTCTVDATVDGSVTGLQAVLDDTDTQIAFGRQDKDTDTFTAGQLIGVKVTTSADWDTASATPSLHCVVTIEA